MAMLAMLAMMAMTAMAVMTAMMAMMALVAMMAMMAMVAMVAITASLNQHLDDQRFPEKGRSHPSPHFIHHPSPTSSPTINTYHHP